MLSCTYTSSCLHTHMHLDLQAILASAKRQHATIVAGGEQKLSEAKGELLAARVSVGVGWGTLFLQNRNRDVGPNFLAGNACFLRSL